MASLILTRLRKLEKVKRRRSPKPILNICGDYSLDLIIGVKTPAAELVMRLPAETVAGMVARGVVTLGTWVLTAEYAPAACQEAATGGWTDELAQTPHFAFDDAVAASGDLLPDGWGI